jgi:hypothetical protein
MSSWDQANRGGEIERKLAKLLMITVLSINYFMVKTKRILDLCLEELSHVIYYYMFTSVVIAGGFIQLLLLSYLVYTSAKKRLKCEERSSLKLTVIPVNKRKEFYMFYIKN